METINDPVRVPVRREVSHRPVSGDGFGEQPVEGWGVELPTEWKRSAPWRVGVHRRRLMLHADLARLRLAGAQADERAELYRLLHDAQEAGEADVTMRKWWSGTEVERAWAALREVEERTLDLLPDDELVARAADAATHATWYLKSDDKRLQHLESLRAETVKSSPPAPVAGLRAAVAQVLRASHAEADRAHQQARALRNRMLLGSSISVVLAVVVVLLQRWLGATSLIDLPAGSTLATWKLVVIVMLLGSVGALFTAIPAMSQVPSDFGPFNLPLQQAILKLAFAPLVAIGGFALVGTGVFDESSPDTWPGVVVLAMLLGAGQQTVTRYVDERAGKILAAAAPSSDSTPT
jgi:hypothetical protein